MLTNFRLTLSWFSLLYYSCHSHTNVAAWVHTFSTLLASSSLLNIAIHVLYQAMYSKMVSLLSCLSRDSSVWVLNLQPFEVKVGRWQLCFRYIRMRYRHGYSVCLMYINNATDLLLGLAWRNDVVDVTRIENICASSRTRMRIRYKIRSLSEAAKCHIQSVHSSLQVEHFPSLLLSISRLLDAREGLLRDVCEWEAW